MLLFDALLVSRARAAKSKAKGASPTETATPAESVAMPPSGRSGILAGLDADQARAAEAVDGPLMVIALAVGLIVSLVQALTQIQEQTLVFVPKIVAVFAALLLFLPFMGDALAGYMGRVAARIATGG